MEIRITLDHIIELLTVLTLICLSLSILGIFNLLSNNNKILLEVCQIMMTKKDKSNEKETSYEI